MKKALAGLILTLFLSSAGYADEGHGMMERGMMGGGGKNMMRGMMGMMGMGSTPWFHHGVSLTLMHSDALGLEEGQKEKLEGIRTRYTKELIKLNAEAQIEELDLENLLRADTIDLSKAKATLTKVSDLEGQVRYLRIEAFTEAKKVLTGEQRVKLRQLMENPAAMMGEKSPMMPGGMMRGGMREDRHK